MTIAIPPPGLAEQAALGPGWSSWLDQLPRLAAGLLDEWVLAPDGPATHGRSSLVVPVRTESGAGAVLKVSWDGDDRSRYESHALQQWGGRGAVRVLRADPHRRAILLERLHTTDLGSVGDVEASKIVAGLYRRLHVPAMPYLVPLTTLVRRSLDALAGLPRDAPVPRRLVEHALSAGRELVDDPQSVGRLIHGELRHDKVLAGEREPWLAISPRPVSGDPCYEPAAMLWHGWDSMRAAGDVRRALRLRFDTLVDAAGMDEDRARSWVVVRMVGTAGDTIDVAGRAGRRLGNEERDWITRSITMIKAVQN